MERRAAGLIFVVVLAMPGCNSRQANSGATPSTKAGEAATKTRLTMAPATANFDFYLLNLSWSPEFCHSHARDVECAQHATFVLHGLWPQNANGSYPEKCSNAPGPADPAAYKDIYPDPGLLEHEWRTHGTCSGLNADDFFHNARAAYRSVTIPSTFSNFTRQISMTPEQILGLFTAANPGIPRESLAMSCGNNYLTAVEVCLDKSLHPIACSSVRSCRAKTVRIPPP